VKNYQGMPSRHLGSNTKLKTLIFFNFWKAYWFDKGWSIVLLEVKPYEESDWHSILSKK